MKEDLVRRYNELLKPSGALVNEMASLEGDIIILGIGGKMGPALARLARQAIDIAGVSKKVIGVARFSDPGLQHELEQHGVQTIKADLLDDRALQALPELPNVLYLAGQKFGTTGKEPFTWAMNTYLPGRVADKFKHARIVVFSTGNVYPFVPLESGGAKETNLPDPVGEYAQSCLGRERMFQYFASINRTPLVIYRLNYANDVTYGVLLEIGRAVKEKRPIDLRMGFVNVIWQNDANEIAIRALRHCSYPEKILNVTGSETLSVRWIAEEFGKVFHEQPVFINEEQPTALLSNAAESVKIFGHPRVSVSEMIDLIAEWISAGGK
ncbi:MAG TPA: epimerase, partial [Cyclobacteriaceae bacterium]|nr:epimerase [Cyclobacteriaceae bacterium]